MELATPAIALLAGALFGMTSHVQKLALRDMDGLSGAFVTVATMALPFWLAAPFIVERAWWTTEAAALFALCGLLFPAMGQRLQIASVARVGPTLTTAIGSFTPLFAVIPALVLLGEEPDAATLLGGAVLMSGLVMAAFIRGAGDLRVPLAALALPLGAALVRGIVQPVAKAGYAEVPSPVFSVLVMASVSTLVIGSMLVLRHDPVPPAAPGSRRRGGLWFALNGLIIGAGILALQVALSLGKVSVVAPLVATSPFWALLAGVLWFRSERLGWRHALVACVVVAGSVLIVAV